MGDVAAVRNATPFIGRAPELGRLRELLKGTAAGSPAAVLLAGDAGVGKTSLATEFGRFARESGAIVLTGRNVDLGSGGLPYLPFSEALAQVLREGRPGASSERAVAARDVVLSIASMRPSLARLVGRDESLLAQSTSGDADLDRLALFEAVSEALVRICATVAPIVVVIEDLHWAEQSTRDLLRFLLTRLGSDPLMFVGTYRADDLHRRHPLRPLLAELVRLPAVELMELHPFDDAELRAFLDAVHGGEVPARVVQRIGERSSGNAYFAEELLSAGPGDDRLPTALTDVLIDRLERLKPATQQLMRVASVIGAFRIEDALLRTAAIEGASLTAADAADALRDAVAHQVLVTDDTDRFGFRHALLQEAVYDDLLPGERVRLHGVVARLLGENSAGDNSTGDAAEQARHSLAAHDLPQALSASLRAAAAATRRLAPAEALSQYEQVLQLWDSVPAQKRPAGADLVTTGLAAAEAAGNAGLRERAVALAEAAITAAGNDTAAGAITPAGNDLGKVNEARAALAVHLYATDRTPELRVVARAVIDAHPGASLSAPAPEPTPALVRTRGILARALFSIGEIDAAMEVVRPGLAEARSLGMRAEEADLEMTWSSVDGMLGRPDSDAHLQLARDAAQVAGDPGMMMRVAYSGLIDRFEEGDLTGVLDLVSESMALAERAGLANSLYATQCRWIRVNTHWMLGDAESAMAAVLEGCRDLPTFGSRQLQHAALPILAARAPDEALQWVHDLEIVRTNPWDAPSRWAATAEAHFWLGDLTRSLECSGTAIDVLETLGEPYVLMGIAMDVNAIGVAADVAAAARSAGDQAAADDAVAQAQRFAVDARERAAKGRPRRSRMGPEGRAWLTRLDAEEARLTGTDTVAQWTAAVDAFSVVAVYDEARCRWRLVQRLLAAGQRDDARAHLARARSAASSLGAQPLLAALDDLGRRGRLSASTASTASALDGHLTPRERDVMRLVAQGLTNRAIGERLFISEKTASVHVSNVLTKLGASGRAEAVAIATRDDLL